MARVTHVKKAQPRFKTKPVLGADGKPVKRQVLRKDGTPKLTRKGQPIFQTATVRDLTKPLPNDKCGKCGKEIKPGDPYKWVKPKSGPYGGTKRVRCAACPSWRPSELTSSGALSSLYAAQEAAEDALGAWDQESVDDLRSILTDLAEGVREAGQVYRESAENMESGFGHSTSMSEELTEKADALDGAADEIENMESDFEEWDEDARKGDIEADETYDWDEDPQGHLATLEAEKETWAGEQEDIVVNAIDAAGSAL